MASERKTHAHFGVSGRTIRNWLAEARKRRIGTFRALSAEEALAEAEENIRAMEAIAWANLRAAQEGRQVALWMRQIGDLTAQRLSLVERTGAFDALRAERQAGRDRRAAMGVDSAESPSGKELNRLNRM